MTFTNQELPEYNILLQILKNKSEASHKVISALTQKCTKEQLDGFLKSYIHMLMNRIFRSKNRLHEMTVYNLSYRYYKIAWGIRKFKNSDS